VTRVEQALLGARVEPRRATRQRLQPRAPGLDIHVVHVSDLELAARRGFQLGCDIEHFIVEEVQARDGQLALWALGLFLYAEELTTRPELSHAVPLGIFDLVAEEQRAIELPARLSQLLPKAGAVEDVVAEDQTDRIRPDEISTDDERLGQAVRRCLNRVAEAHAQVFAGAQQALEQGQVLRCRNDQHLLDTRQHQYRQRVVDHRFVINRKQLLRDHPGQRIKPGATAASQNDALHGLRIGHWAATIAS